MPINIDKLLTVQKAKETKLGSLYPSQPYTTTEPAYEPQSIDRLVDADSAILKGKTGETRFSGFDAYEVQHNDPESLNYFKTPQGQKKMARQKEHLASQLGISSADVTTDMVYKEGEKQKLDALYTLMGRPKGTDGKEWTPGPIGYSPSREGGIELGSRANPLGVKILSQDQGSDYYGRGLSVVADSKGKLLTNRFNTPERNTDYGSTYSAGGKPSVEDVRKWNQETNGGANPSTIENAGKGLAAGAFDLVSRGMQLGAKGAEEFGTATGMEQLSTGAKKAQRLLNQHRQEGAYNKLLGYDSTQVQKYGEAFKDSVNKGEYFNAVKGLASDPEAAVVAFANSVPEMAAMATVLGLGIVMATNVNANLYKLNESARLQGREATTEEKAISMGMSAVGTYLDRLGDKAMLGNKLVSGKLVDGIKGTLAAMSPTVRSGVLSTMGGTLAKIGVTSAEFAGRTAMEGATEGAQTILENKASDVSLMNTDLSKSERDKALEATGIGLGAGGIGTTGSMAPQIASTGKSAIESVGKGLTKLSEISTGKTAAGIKEKYAAEAAAKEAERVSIVDEARTPDSIKAEMTALLDNLDTAIENDDTSTIASTKAKLDELKAERDALKTSVDTLVKDYKSTVENAVGEIDYTDPKDVEVTAKMAGVENLQSLYDKTKKVGLELLSGSTNLKNISSKKTSQYDVSAISDAKINDTLEGKGLGEDVVGTGSLSESRIQKGMDTTKTEHVSRIKDTITKVKSSITTEATATLQKILPEGEKVTDASLARILSIGISAVEDAIEAEKNKSDITEDIAREDTLAVQLGREHINSFGVNVTGEAKDVASVNKERGTAILDFLEQVGVINRTDPKAVSNKNIVGADEKKITNRGPFAVTSEGEKIWIPSIEFTKEYQSTMSVVPKGKNGEVLQKPSKLSNQTVDAMRMMNRLFNPVNNEMVQYEGQEQVVTHKAGKEVKISKEHQKIIEDYSKLKYKIKPEFMALLKELNAERAKYKDFDSFLKSPMIEQLLGVKDGVPELLKDSEKGKFIGRSGSLAKLLENLDAIEALMNEEDGFNFHYESAINERIHVLQTVLDFQGDKYMARNMLGETVKVPEGKQRMLLKEVVSELSKMAGFPKNTTLSEILEMPDIQQILESIPKGAMTLKDLLAAKKLLRIKDSMSPFKLMSLLKALYDIEKSYNYNEKHVDKTITTSYVVQNDASASGVMNTLMNLSGIQAVQDILSDIWAGTDPYAIVSTKVKDMFDKGTVAYAIATKKSNELAEAIQSEDFMRDLAKYLVMPWFYGQSDKNAAKTFGDSVATKLYEDAMLDGSEKARALIVKITGNSNLFEYTKADLAEVAKYFQEDLGTTYVDAVNESFPDVVQYRNTMGDLYKALEKTGQWSGSIKSAFAGMSGSNEKMSVKKLKSMMLQDTTDVPLTVNQMLNNETSFKVNLQHGVDAAILLKTMQKLMKEFPNLKGTMTVHDAIYSTPKVAMKAVQYYNEFAVDAAIEYDFVDAAIDELQEATDKMEEGSPERQRNLGIIQEARTKNDILVAEKRKFLGNKSLSVMGEGGYEAIPYNDRYEGKTTSREKEIAEINRKYEENRAVITSVQSLVEDGDLPGILSTLKDALGEKSAKLLSKIEEAIMKGVRIEFAEDGEFQAVHGIVLVPKDMTKDPVKGARNIDAEMTPEVLVEILAHEIDHAIQLNWIQKNINSDEVKYIKRVLDRLGTSTHNFSRGMKSRLAHMKAPISKANIEYLKEKTGKSEEEIVTAYQVSEMSSMMNEEAFRKEVSEALPVTIITKIMEKIKDLIGKAYTTMAELLKGTGVEDVTKLDINIGTTMEALRMLQDQALQAFIPRTSNMVKGDEVSSKMTGKEALDKVEKATDALGEKIQASDRMASDFIIIWGDAFYETIAPNIKNGHESLKRTSKIYQEAVNIMNTYFFDADFMQRIQARLGVSGDTMQKLQADMLTVMEAYKQNTRQRAEALSALRRTIEASHTEKEAETIWSIFSQTGISDMLKMPGILDSLINGSVTIEDTMKNVSSKFTDKQKAILDDVAEYYNTGLTTTGNTNVEMTELTSNEAYVYTSLKALSKVDGAQKLLGKMDKELVNELLSLATINSNINDEINRRGYGADGKRYSANAEYNINYDGTYVMDVVDGGKEVIAVDQEDMDKVLVEKGGKAWTVISKPSGDKLGVMVRENMSPGRTAGAGLGLNRYVNGVMIGGDKAEKIQKKLDAIKDPVKQKEWLLKNNMVKDGYKFRLLLSTADKIKHLGLKQDVAESMYRTIMHNSDLMAAEGVRKMVLEKGIKKIPTVATLEKFEALLAFNYKEGIRGSRVEVEPFLNLTLPYSDIDVILKQYPMIAKFYKVPDNVTSFNSFNKNIQLVQRGPAEILLGHANFSVFSNSHPQLAEMERAYKQIVALIKQRLIVLSPVKLAKDTLSNVGVLSIMGMSPKQILNGYKEGAVEYKQYADARTELVRLEMEVHRANSMVKMTGTDISKKGLTSAVQNRDAQVRKLSSMKFDTAFKAGFIQSQGTSMMTHDADTISGLQKNVKDIIDKYTHTKDGNPNNVYKAIKWWMTAGVNIDEVLLAASTHAKVNGNTVGESLISLAESIRNKKTDKSVAGYISEILMLPGSTAVNAGGAYMVTSDTISKYIMQQWLTTQISPETKQKYTLDEATTKAMVMFIDYRPNMPKEIKTLSDYGILMFPAFWMNVQKSIFHLVKYHPLSSLGSYALASAMDQEKTQLIMNNIITKADSNKGLFSYPGELVADWVKDLLNG